MKIIKFSVMLTLFALVIAGCKNNNDNNPVNNGDQVSSENSITINGDGFNNQTFTIQATGVTQAYGAFNTGTNVTEGIVVGPAGSSAVSLSFAFPGNSAGTFNWGNLSANTGAVIITVDDKQFVNITDSISTSGKTTITEYGNVGSLIKGNFNGKMVRFNITAGAGDTVDVSGKFAFERRSDK